MRKHILSTVLICIGLIFFIYNYTQINKTNYSEIIFTEKSKEFETSFSNFVNAAEKNINSIQANFNKLSKVKDTTYTKDYFLNFMENKPYLVSIILIIDTVKVGILKDKESLMFAIDSNKTLDIVRWQRFENKKLISSWQESFELSIDKTQWFNELINNKKQIQWTYNIDKENSDKFLYAGFSYHGENTKNSIILMKFSRLKLLEYFNISQQYKQANLWVEAQNNRRNSISEIEKVDSIQISALNHFKRFDKKEYGTFNFNYKSNNYWSSFKYFKVKTGLSYYLLTIPDKDIQLNAVPPYLKLMKWISLIFILIGIIIFFIKKRFFYKVNKMTILSLKEILNDDENRYLEFKSSARWDYRQEKTNPELEKVVLKTLAAFGNTDGGILLIGVDDDKNILGLENDFKTLKKSTADYYEIHLRNLFHNAMGVKYVSKYVRMEFEGYENQKIICKIKVLATNEPIYLKFKNKNGQVEEKFFVRSGNSSQEIKSMSEINDYINTRFKK